MSLNLKMRVTVWRKHHPSQLNEHHSKDNVSAQFQKLIFNMEILHLKSKIITKRLRQVILSHLMLMLDCSMNLLSLILRILLKKNEKMRDLLKDRWKWSNLCLKLRLQHHSSQLLTSKTEILKYHRRYECLGLAK